jgi:hypothetical protein
VIGQTLVIANTRIFGPVVRVANEILVFDRAWTACSSASRSRSDFMEILTRQPTIMRENTSITKAR